MRKIYTLIILSFITLQTHGMNLFVQTPDNGTISLDVEPSDSAENVKAKIFDQISVPVINQVLTWNGTTIQDNQTLADVGIVTNNSSIVLTVTTTTQVPEKMSYQAVVRNTTNNLVTNQPVGMQISILQGSSTGTAVYVEMQTPTSNANGLVSLEIGGGTVVSGNMATINWANGPYFIKTETDPTGGSSYTITGTSQLLSAPYALYAKTSGSSTPGPIGPQGPIGLTGATGPQGIAGTNGTNGQGVPTGGTANQVLAKVDGTNYNTTWVTPASGSADNLGNHTATQALNMSNNNITNVNNITASKIAIGKADVNITSILNPGTGAILSADIPITNTASFIKITGLPTATAHTLQGFQGGIDGRLLYIYNATLQNINLINNSPNEPNGVKIALLNTAPVTTQAVLYTFIYDASQFSGNGGWVLISVRD